MYRYILVGRKEERALDSWNTQTCPLLLNCFNLVIVLYCFKAVKILERLTFDCRSCDLKLREAGGPKESNVKKKKEEELERRETFEMRERSEIGTGC